MRVRHFWKSLYPLWGTVTLAVTLQKTLSIWGFIYCSWGHVFPPIFPLDAFVIRFEGTDVLRRLVRVRRAVRSTIDVYSAANWKQLQRGISCTLRYLFNWTARAVHSLCSVDGWWRIWYPLPSEKCNYGFRTQKLWSMCGYCAEYSFSVKTFFSLIISVCFFQWNW